MGNYVYSVHNRLDDKLYNILGRGDLPCVVFGRTIKEQSVPGTQYYFADGKVKYRTGTDVGFAFTSPILDRDNNPVPCIFTVPENLEFNRMDDVDYVRQYTRSAVRLNANTASPDFIIRDGEIICVKKDIDKYVRIRYYKRKNSRVQQIRKGRRYVTTGMKFFNCYNQYHARKITVFPVCSRRPSAMSIYNYDFIQKYEPKSDYNIHAYTYDKNKNICYFRAAKIRGSSEGSSIFLFRCSEFEKLNLNDRWQNSFDFENTLKHGDLINVECEPLPDAGNKYTFTNQRTGNDMYVYIESVTGSKKRRRRWRYCLLNKK